MARKQDKLLTDKKKCGRKRIVSSPEEMQDRAEQYFTNCEQKGYTPNIAGLALYLGFTDRKMISEYFNKYPEFQEVIGYIKLYMEDKLLIKLENKETATAGVIFNLKCNFGYNDKQQEESEKINNMASALSTAMKIIENQSINNENN